MPRDCISYLLLHNKLPEWLKTTQVLSQRLPGSGVQALGLLLKVSSHPSKCVAGPQFYLDDKLERNPKPNLFWLLPEFISWLLYD